MKLVVATKGKKAGEINKLVELVLYIITYTIAFLVAEALFDSFVISEDYKILFSILAVCIIYGLNQVVKPILVTITMPLTGITFGLFYFVINTIILKITDWIMLSKLNFEDIFILFFISIVISFIHWILEDVIIKQLVRKARRR